MTATAGFGRDFRQALGSFATGVTIVTACCPQGRRAGLTANSFSSVSLDPPLVLWSLANRAASLGIFTTASHFAIHILAEHQQHLSAQFVARDVDRFAGLTVGLGRGNSPLIDGVAAVFECRLHAMHPGGDHTIFIGEVERYAQADHHPLVFHRGQYRVLQPVDAA